MYTYESKLEFLEVGVGWGAGSWSTVCNFAVTSESFQPWINFSVVATRDIFDWQEITFY